MDRWGAAARSAGIPFFSSPAFFLKSGHRQVPRSPSSSSPQEPDPLLPQVRTPPSAGIPFFLKSSSSREWSAAEALAPAVGAGRGAGPGSGVRRRVLQECYGVGGRSQFNLTRCTSKHLFGICHVLRFQIAISCTSKHLIWYCSTFPILL